MERTFVVVEWIDSASESDVNLNEESPSLTRQMSVGMLWADTKESITLVQNYDRSQQDCDTIVIPRMCVISLTQLFPEIPLPRPEERGERKDPRIQRVLDQADECRSCRADKRLRPP